MKKILLYIFTGLFLSLATPSFAQVDSSKLAETQKELDKDRKKADKLQRKAEKMEKKMKRQERRMERKEKKRERKLKDIEKGEKKLEKIRENNNGTGFIYRKRAEKIRHVLPV